MFRVDSDYAARRHARKFLGINDPDYYEWETHIFFDDAFKVTDRYPHFSLYPYKEAKFHVQWVAGLLIKCQFYF